MNLSSFYGKKVEITTRNGLAFSGKVSDYIYPEDNENEKESIVIDAEDGSLVEFYDEDILSIRIM